MTVLSKTKYFYILQIDVKKKYVYLRFMNQSVLFEHLYIFPGFFFYDLYCISDILSTILNLHCNISTSCTVTLMV